MKQLKFLAAFGALLVLATGAASAKDATLGALLIHHPWIKVPPPGAAVAAAYAAIENTGKDDDLLLSVTVTGVGKVQLHDMKMQGDTMTMPELKDGLALPAGQTTTLKQGSFHMMLMGLKAAPKEGDVVKGSMTFEKAGTVDIEFDVAKP